MTTNKMEPVAYLRKDQIDHVKRIGPVLGEISYSPRADRVPVYAAPPVQGQPVGETVLLPGAEGFTTAVFKAIKVPAGTKLYTAPQPAPDVTQMVEALQAISRNELDAQRAQHIAAVALADHRKQGGE